MGHAGWIPAAIYNNMCWEPNPKNPAVNQKYQGWLLGRPTQVICVQNQQAPPNYGAAPGNPQANMV